MSKMQSPAYQRAFWRHSDGYKISCQEAEADTIEIENKNGCYRSSLSFAWPQDQVKAWELTCMLDTAYHRGQAAAKAEVRAVLGL